MTKQSKVSFGIINCNRLFYAKSCLYSLLETTKTYENKEIVFIDNASIEEGTNGFIEKIRGLGVKTIKQSTRDPANEYAKALNVFCNEATGDFIVPLQGDMQFVLNGWLEHYVDFYSKNIDDVGCIILDAQRTITNQKHQFTCPVGDNFNFVYDLHRNPIMGAADCFYSKKIIDCIKPWSEDNRSHEGGQDSETAMLTKIRKFLEHNYTLTYKCAMPIIPVSAAIYTDMRGTNARIRGNKRYGDYWEAKQSEISGAEKNNFYYEILNSLEQAEKYKSRTIPVGIEEIIKPIGFDLPIDFNGNLLKNPIRPETATSKDCVILYEEKTNIIEAKEDYLNEWLDG